MRKMTHDLITIAVDGTVTKTDLPARDQYSHLRTAMNGYIETVPHFVGYEKRPCVAYCDEDGIGKNLLLNDTATKLWRDILGYEEKDLGTKWNYRSTIFGPLVIMRKKAVEPAI